MSSPPSARIVQSLVLRRWNGSEEVDEHGDNGAQSLGHLHISLWLVQAVLNTQKKRRDHADGGGRAHQAMGGCGLGGVHGRCVAPCVVGADSHTRTTRRSVAIASPNASLRFPAAGSGQGFDEASPHISAAYVLSLEASMEGGGSVQYSVDASATSCIVYVLGCFLK